MLNRIFKVIPAAGVIFLSCTAFGADAPGQASPDQIRSQLRDEARKQAEEVVNRAVIAQLIATGQEASGILADFQTKTESLAARMTKLLTNDDGKRLAMDDTAFLHFMDLQDHPPPSSEEIKARKETVDSIVAKLKEQLPASAVAYTPPVSMRDEVGSTREWAINGLSRATETSGWLDSVIAQSAKGASFEKAQTLQQRIDAYRAERIALLAKSRKDAETQAIPDAQRTVADAARAAVLLEAKENADQLRHESEAKMERMRIEYEMKIKQLQEAQQQKVDALNKQLAEAKAGRVIQDAKNEVTVQKAEQDAGMVKKRQACHDPAVASVLQPFLAKGYWQPKSGRGIDSEPMSLSEIRAYGALDSSKAGLERLMQCANLRGNDRPHWGLFLSVGEQSPTPTQLEAAKRAQAYLVDLGDALVAEGMLSP